MQRVGDKILADIRIFCVSLNLCSSLLEILYKESKIGGVRIAEANVINVRGDRATAILTLSTEEP